MIRTNSRSVARLPFFAAIGVAMAVIGNPSKGADPSSAMLGVIPVDLVGQVIVKDVYDGSPAHIAGLRAGDRILEIDDKAVSNAADLIDLIGEYQPNARIEIRASREGWVKQLSVTLAKRGDVVRRPLSSVAQQQPQTARSVVRPRGFVDPERARHINDPYYRSKKSRW